MDKIPLTPTKQIRFFQLVHLLKVSPATIYLWRRGETKSPPLPVRIKTNKRKNEAWVDLNQLHQWLAQNRPGLLPRLKKALKEEKLPRILHEQPKSNNQNADFHT